MSSRAEPSYLVDGWMGKARYGEYAYLLGMYLGDGCISRSPRTERLRITLDKAYPGIIEECRAAVATLMPHNAVAVVQRKGCVDVSCYSNRWSDILPQHGAGPKHQRDIWLEPWQQVIVGAEVRRFLRGLFHSDGSYVQNRVRSKKGRVYVYDRYFFSNHSHDIKRLFCWACSLIGVETRPDGPWQISVARRASVAKLNEFLGPKR